MTAGTETRMTYIDTLDPDKVASSIETLRRQDDPAAERLRSYAGDDDRFMLWLALLNRGCVRTFGLGFQDMEDWSWRDAYDSGSSPREALTDAADDLGWYALLGESE